IVSGDEWCALGVMVVVAGGGRCWVGVLVGSRCSGSDQPGRAKSGSSQLRPPFNAKEFVVCLWFSVMRDNDWKEVNHKKCRSVFDRLKPSPSQYLKFNDLDKVGTLADVFNVSRKNKLGQMFSFCRFIKVDNSDSLIEALANKWVGKLRLHAKDTNVNSYAFAVKGRPAAGNSKETSSVNERGGDPNTAMEIPLFDTNEFPFAVLGCYQDFRSIANARTLCHTEGFADVDIKYLGGLWTLFNFNSTEVRDKFLNHIGIKTWFSVIKPWHDDFLVDERLVWLEVEGIPIHAWEHFVFQSICNKWGDLIFSDDSDMSNRLSKRLCIKSKHSELIFATIYVTGKPQIVRMSSLRILMTWIIRMQNDNLVNGLFGDNVDVNGDDLVYDNNGNEDKDGVDPYDGLHGDVSLGSDPFGLDHLINKKVCKDIQDPATSETPPSLLVFRLLLMLIHRLVIKRMFHPKSHWLLILIRFPVRVKGFGDLNKRKWVRDLCHCHQVNLLALQETKMDHVDPWVLRQDCGSPPRSESSGLRFMLLRIWLGKFALWESIINLLNNWDRISITMDNFNEVREAGERFGSCYNERHSDIFNNFISRASLNDVPLGIPDHRPILMKEMVSDFGPTPFRFFNSWLEVDGFHSLGVIRLWAALQRATSSSIKKGNLLRLSSIDIKTDQRLASDVDLCDRRESIRIIGEIDKREAKDIIQKSRIKWALDEIKRAVWDCGGDRAPGPDGFTFNFFTTFWDLIESDVCRFVLDFFSTGTFPKGCNSSVIALIPKVSNATLVTDFRPISLIGCQYKIFGKLLANRLSCVIDSCISPEQYAFIKNHNILDGPLILSEMMAWHRKNKKQLMVFKIKGCLRNARSSVLVNGFPLKEFKIFRGLRQGDPLSPFLFILAMEGLHAIVSKAVNLGIFKCTSLGANKLCISHLMYADDVIFMGEWSVNNVNNLLCILRCFFLVSGLKINVHKCSLSGIGMSHDDILHMANIIGCGAATLPFKYLGVPVGCNMSRCSYWDPIINKFSSRLDLWKARLLSVRGRLTLIKSVLGSLFIYFMSLYKVPSLVCNRLESMRNHFFIGADLGEKKMTWMALNKLPTRVNLDRKGIDVHSVLCPVCLEEVETVNHLFFSCELASKIWALLANWWAIDIPFCVNLADWFSWIDSSPTSAKANSRYLGVRCIRYTGPGPSVRMVRDSVQLETTVNTISHEYLLEFTSEYGIPEMLHPELPGPRNRIVDFPEGKVEMDLFSLIRAPNPTKVKTESRPRGPHEVPLLTLTASRVIEMDEPAVATDSSGVIEKSPLDFAHEDGASDQGTAAPEMPPPEDVPATAAPGVGQAEEAVAAEPPVARESRKRCHDGVDVNAPPKSLRRDHADLRPSCSSHGGKSLAAMQLCLASNVFVSEGAPADVSDPDPLSFVDAPSHHPVDVAQSSQGIAAVGDPESENVSSPVEVGSPGSVYHPEWGVTNGSLLDTPEACQDLVARRDKRIEARELEIKNLEALLETEADMKRAAEDKSAGLIKELEDMRARFSDLQVSHGQLSQQVASLKEQVSGEEKLKAAFKEFKRYEDERVERRCTELDARLDALSIEFEEELYPHMLTAIAGRRWVVGHGLCLAMMKCAESLEMRQAFADVVSVGVVKGTSEGLKHGVEHGQAQLTIESIEAYDPEAEAEFVAALQSLKDLKYPLLDQLEGLDAPMDVIMAALYFESDTGGMPHNIYTTSAPAPLISPSPCTRSNVCYAP
nr:RNA-directed DNA polymerase, eukaryota [Tanacetum cinerariifolium]